MDGFAPAEGGGGKHEGMTRPAEHATPNGWAFMTGAGVEVARRKPRFTTDDLERIRQDRQGPRTHENRAMGPLMLDLCKRGVCVPTDDWFESQQRGNHKRPMRSWHSLIYQGPPIRRPTRRRIIDPRQLDMLAEPASAAFQRG